MSDERSNNKVLIAKNDQEEFYCQAKGFTYIPDMVKHKYGVSTRKPIEEWFLIGLDFIKEHFPEYEIFTLGSSCVFGERFVINLTVVEFELPGEQEFTNLVKELKGSDQAIRNKLKAPWEWNYAAKNGNKIVFLVGCNDLAYFLKHRFEFRNDNHRSYMASFLKDQSQMTSVDYKILHDGSIVEFDENKLDKEDCFIFENYNDIEFIRSPLKVTN